MSRKVHETKFPDMRIKTNSPLRQLYNASGQSMTLSFTFVIP